jgi:hypothetical protein
MKIHLVKNDRVASPENEMLQIALFQDLINNFGAD